MAPSELQPPLNFADGGAVSWAGDTTVYNTQSQIGNMLATPGGFGSMATQFTGSAPFDPNQSPFSYYQDSNQTQEQEQGYDFNLGTILQPMPQVAPPLNPTIGSFSTDAYNSITPPLSGGNINPPEMEMPVAEMAKGGNVSNLINRLHGEFSKRGLDMNKMIAHRKAYAYGGDVRGGDNPGGLSGDTGAYSGRSIGSSQSVNAAMGRESPAQRDVSYGGGGGGNDRGGGGGGRRESPSYVSPTSDITTANLNAQRAAQEVIAPAAPAMIDVFAPAPATTKFGNINAPFAPGVVPTGIFTPTQAQIAETYRPSDYAGRGLKVEQPGQRASALTGIATAPLSFTPYAKANVPPSPTSEIESYTKNVLRPAATAAQQKLELEAMAEKMRQQAGLQPPTQDAPLPVARPQEPVKYAGRGEVVEQPGERKSAYEQVLAQVVKPNIPLPPIPDRPAMSDVAAASEEDLAPEMFAEPKPAAAQQPVVVGAVKRPPAPLSMAQAKPAYATTSEINQMFEQATPAPNIPLPPIPYRDLGEGNILDTLLKPFKLDTESWINNKAQEYLDQGISPSDAYTRASYDLRDIQLNMGKREGRGGEPVAMPQVAAPIQAAAAPTVPTPVSPALPQALASFKRKYVPLTNYATYGYGPESALYEYTAAEGGAVGPLSQKRK